MLLFCAAVLCRVLVAAVCRISCPCVAIFVLLQNFLLCPPSVLLVLYARCVLCDRSKFFWENYRKLGGFYSEDDEVVLQQRVFLVLFVAINLNTKQSNRNIYLINLIEIEMM